VIVLGCTHYPLLKHTIAAVARDLSSDPVPVVDSAEATAASVAELLAEQRITPATGLPGGPRLELLVTDLPASFDAAARRFLGEGTPAVTQIDIELAQ
jgi:glutamate racemase